MPYEAWLVVAVAMRKAKELGLFLGWTRKKSAEVVGFEPTGTVTDRAASNGVL